MVIESLEELLVEEMKDLLSAEKQLTKALPKMSKAANNEDLKRAFEDHLAQTEEHVARLEQAFKHLGKPARAKTCKAMEGLIEEGAEMIKNESNGNPSIKDAGLIAVAQRVEHYEIAAYGTVCSFCETLGLDEVGELLQQTLDEEKETDEKLTELATGSINLDAAGEESESEEDDDESDDMTDEDESEEEDDEASDVEAEEEEMSSGSSQKKRRR